MFKIKLTAKARREIRELSSQEKISVAEVIEDLKDNPLIGKSLTRDLIRRYSYRVGVYRLVYQIKLKDEIIIIMSVGHRSKVYD